jgi:MarR family
MPCPIHNRFVKHAPVIFWAGEDWSVLNRCPASSRDKTSVRPKEAAEGRFMTTERENVCLEDSVQGCLQSIGISLISEWDMLAFVYRHGPSLTSTEQIAKLIGYERGTVGAALERLEGQSLIERLGPAKGVRLHRMRAHAGHQRCLLQLVSL